MTDTPATLAARITNYLGNGGLWNPEMMDHDKVRDLLLDCREVLLAGANSREAVIDEPGGSAWRKRAEEAEAKLSDLGEKPYTLEEMQTRTRNREVGKQVNTILDAELEARTYHGATPCLGCGARSGQPHAITCPTVRGSLSAPETAEK